MTGPPLAAALVRARRLAVPIACEWVPLARIVGRTLGEDVVSRIDLPAADSAAMDGWAVRAVDVPGVLRRVGESRAGAPWDGILARGQAVRISTGALIPSGADAVLRAEEGSEDGEMVLARAAPAPGRDVRNAAEDLRVGKVVLAAGVRLDAHRVGAVAAAGHAGAVCRTMIDVAIIVTGSELVEPGEPARHGSVFDSNRYGLMAQTQAAGARVVVARSVPDDSDGVRRALADGLASAGLLVVAGGLSVGRHDHVRAALADLGMSTVVGGIAMRPGRPTTIGTVGHTRVLAVPGNPAAAAIGFHLLGRALLGAEAPWTRLPLGISWQSRRHADDVLRCTEVGGVAEPVTAQGSASVSSLAEADVLAWLPWGTRSFPAGTPVRVSRLS